MKKTSYSDRFRWFESYFKRNIEHHPGFEPEYLAMQSMNEFLLKENPDAEDLRKAIVIFNETSEKPHYNGVGWFDLKLHLRGFLHVNEISFKEASDHTLEIME